MSREPNPNDARSTMVCLLPAGRAAMENAAPKHVEDVRRNFIDLMTPAELDLLATLNERIQRHLATHLRSPTKTSPRNLHRLRRFSRRAYRRESMLNPTRRSGW